MNAAAKLPGIKEDELERLGKCALCGKHLLEQPTFYRVTLTRAMLDQGAIRRRVGLELQLGNAALASAMGPDEDIAKIFAGPVEVVVHESCAGKVGHLLRLFP